MRTTAVCVALGLMGLAACGGQTETVTETVPSVNEDDATTETATKPPVQLSPEQAPVIYHDHINDLDFEWAWQRLSPELQSEFGGHDAWVAGYGNTYSSKAVNVQLLDRTGNQADLSFEVRSRDFDACGRDLDGRFVGTWEIQLTETDFVLLDSDFERTSGEPPIMDPNLCPGASPVAPPPAPIEPPAGDCDPSYVQCIPSPPPDLDCYDIGFEVDVVGSDPHGLDADFDGIGCEAY